MGGWMGGWMDGSLSRVISRAPVELIIQKKGLSLKIN